MLLSLAYLLLNRPMQRRFEADPLFQATMLLLQERIPKATVLHMPSNELADIRVAAGPTEISMRILTTPHTAIPEVQLLSNGRYHVMVSNAGGGYSRWKDMTITRWREDTTRDHWGSFCYLRDVTSGKFGLSQRGLIGGGPELSACHIAQVAEATPVVTRGIFTPAGDGHIFPTAVTPARVAHHDVVSTIG